MKKILKIEKDSVYESFIGRRADLTLLPVVQEELTALSEKLLISRGQFAKIVPSAVKVNDKFIKPSARFKIGQEITIDIDLIIEHLNQLSEINYDKIEAVKSDLQVIAETKDYLIVNKPKNVVVHPAPGTTTTTLAAMVKYYLESKDEFDINMERAGLVHRLDKGVSGLMVFAKNREFQLELKKQFEEHRVLKVYCAQIENEPSHKDLRSKAVVEMNGYIARKSSNRKLMEFYESAQSRADERVAKSRLLYLGDKQLLIRILTGRKHQIRATLKYLGISIVGDTAYGSKAAGLGIELEAVVLGFEYKGEFMKYSLTDTAEVDVL